MDGAYGLHEWSDEHRLMVSFGMNTQKDIIHVCVCMCVAYKIHRWKRFMAQFGCTKHNFCDISSARWLVAWQWTVSGDIAHQRQLHCSNKTENQKQFSRNEKTKQQSEETIRTYLLTNHFSLFIAHTHLHTITKETTATNWTERKCHSRSEKICIFFLLQ